MVVKNFSDGEIYVQVKESVRGDDVFIIQPVCDPVNENLMELLIIIDAFKRASAKTITAVIPYYAAYPCQNVPKAVHQHEVEYPHPGNRFPEHVR